MRCGHRWIQTNSSPGCSTDDGSRSKRCSGCMPPPAARHPRSRSSSAPRQGRSWTRSSAARRRRRATPAALRCSANDAALDGNLQQLLLAMSKSASTDVGPIETVLAAVGERAALQNFQVDNESGWFTDRRTVRPAINCHCTDASVRAQVDRSSRLGRCGARGRARRGVAAGRGDTALQVGPARRPGRGAGTICRLRAEAARRLVSRRRRSYVCS